MSQRGGSGVKGVCCAPQETEFGSQNPCHKPGIVLNVPVTSLFLGAETGG